MNRDSLSSRLNVSFQQKRTVSQVSKSLGIPERIVSLWRKQWASRTPYLFEDVRLISPDVAEKIKQLCSQGDTTEQISVNVGLRQEDVKQLTADAPAAAPLAEADRELVEECEVLAKAKQKLQDTNRIERKAFRAQARYENASAALLSEVLELMKQNSYHYDKLPAVTVQPLSATCQAAGVIQLSDLHFNELISIAGNTFDFTVASKRLKLFAEHTIRLFQAYEVENVLIAMTGDMLNSDRRLDEILAAATNRARALFLAGDLMQQFITEIRKHFRVTVAYVTGNESRNGDVISWTKAVATDNYDTLLFHLLKSMFTGVEGVDFVDEDDNEVPITVNNSTFLLMHGHGKMERDVEQNVTKAIGRYAHTGIIIDYVLLGHMHSARIGDFCARSASLAGANAYSEHSLNLIGRASQNIFIVDAQKRVHGMKVDLQFTEDVKDAYAIDERLVAYNAKSADKARIHGFSPYKVGC